MESEGVQFAGFWRRLGAFLIDVLVLGLIGAVLAYPFFDQLARLGSSARAVGFIVAGAYFGVLNSDLGKGQTIGKRLLGLRVVNAEGTPLPVSRAVLRFLPMGTPYFLNNLPLRGTALQGPALCILSVLVFGLGLSGLYLFIFNRPSRQMVHDLLVGSYVVLWQPNALVQRNPLNARHYIACATILIVSIVAPYFTSSLTNKGRFAGLIQIQQAVETRPWVQRAVVNQGKTFFASSRAGSTSKTYLSLSVTVNDGMIQDESRAAEIARAALEAYPGAVGVDVIQVVLRYGYDIGLASSSRSQAYAHSAAQWREKGA